MLQTWFRFGKHQSLKQAGGGVFDGQRMEQQPDGSFRLSMSDYIKQRVYEIPLSKERKKQKEAPLTSEEISKMRGLTGSVLWPARKCRPEVAGPLNQLQRKSTSYRAAQIHEANEIARYLNESLDWNSGHRPFPYKISLSPCALTHPRVR